MTEAIPFLVFDGATVSACLEKRLACFVLGQKPGDDEVGIGSPCLWRAVCGVAPQTPFKTESSIGGRKWFSEVDGAMPATARGTRALPN